MIRVFTGAMLVDGTGGAPVPDAVVVVDGDRVVAAGARGALPWPHDAEVIDVRGRTIIPGLIDAHDHLASHGYGLATRAARSTIRSFQIAWPTAPTACATSCARWSALAPT